ncbi:SGNH/GDSL hydrolase family protein [Amycolatopsis thermalba]|uniref:SGNH/GDSL hydrolase family protein n=1 Tax=Amycolatopsis thermalba TaxID=944492 RepID=A0ABY4NUL2_9PSEU|nr:MULTISPECIES: SGNH/GDSL hydrolase family protein [Amycolatopsis]OXM72914.1 GDSL family lipase [Amycolatopsis sp. KNN50.9b]UQS23703.1 SGNH/GDSL hydrolase family protein [Amycolatopsis thermalba]
MTTDVLTGTLRGAPWRRLAILGDSVAEGLGDPADGYPPPPWADRLADLLREHQPDLAYANLGLRDTRAAQVRDTQLAAALDFRPDLAVVAAGGNDMLRRSFDPVAVEQALSEIVSALRAAGAAVVIMGLFDISRSPLAAADRRDGLRVRLAQLARLTRRVADRHGAWYVDLGDHPASADAGIYSADRLHVNARGHAIVLAETVRRLAAELPR